MGSATGPGNLLLYERSAALRAPGDGDHAVLTVSAARPRFRIQPQAVTVALVALAAYIGYVLFYRHYVDPHVFPVIRSDGLGYYSYLPTYLLEKDPTFHRFVAEHLHGVPSAINMRLDRSTGNYLNQYPIGEAVMLLPFFLVGHAAAILAGRSADGFSGLEQAAVGLGGVTYMVLGLLVLSLSLRRYFSPWVTAATLLTMVFGTNLFHYGTADSMTSHAFSFCLVAILIELTHRWYARPSAVMSLGLGLVMAMIVLVRQANVVYLLLVPLFALDSGRALSERPALLRRRLGRVVIVAVTFLISLVPQFLVWHVATGRWVVYSYPYHFNYFSPEIGGALFSFFPHGAFPWSPALVLAAAGLIPLWRQAKPLFLPVVVVSCLVLYTIASWQFWSYGGGYGHRGFIDLYPLLAFALASLYSILSSLRSRFLVGGLALAACLLVSVQMLHWWKMLISFEGASLQAYIAVLTRPLW